MQIEVEIFPDGFLDMFGLYGRMDVVVYSTEVTFVAMYCLEHTMHPTMHLFVRQDVLH